MKTKIKWILADGQTWRMKLEREHPNHGKIVPIPKAMQRNCGTGTMLIPRPLDVDAIMRGVKKGRLITRRRIRELLAREAGADSACPLTTGIFIRIASETAEEDLRAGKKRITPYWRTINDDGTLSDKLPGGVSAQAERLRQEGFKIEPSRGKHSPRVQDFEKYLI